MATSDLISLIVAITIVFVVGIALNMDILLVYIGNLKNGLSLTPSDKIHLTKALVNVSLHLTVIIQNIICVFWTQLFITNGVYLWMTVVTMFLIFHNYWLTSLLCVYYCTNITNCGHHIFVWLKKSLSSYLLHIILISGLVSFAINLPIFWVCSINLAMNATYQSTIIRATQIQDVTYRVMFATLGSFLPFTIALVSTTFTSWSLINHMWTMKQNNPGFTRSKFQTQINATRTMVLFLLISFIYNVIQIVFFTIPPSVPDAIVIMILFIIISFPIPEAIIIIQSSCKFRKTLLGKFFDRKKRNSEAET